MWTSSPTGMALLPSGRIALGSPVGIFDEGRMDQLRDGAGWQLLDAGENAHATGVRRGLVAAGVPNPSISFFGYWKLGRAALG